MAKIRTKSEHLLKSVLKKEGISAEVVAKWCNISPRSLRRMLRKDIKMDFEMVTTILDKLGYSLIIVKKDNIL